MVTVTPEVGGVDFQGKDPQEAFQFYFRQHWLRLLWPTTKTFVWNLLILVIGYEMFMVVGVPNATARHVMAAILAFFFCLSQLEFITRFYRYFLNITIVTDKKVHRIKKTLVTMDQHESVDLWILENISKKQQGVIQNLLGFGSIILESQDQPLLRIHFTPRIGDIYRHLMHLRERARDKMLGDNVGAGMSRLARTM